MHLSVWQYSNPFQKVSMTNKGAYANFADFTSKVGRHGNAY